MIKYGWDRSRLQNKGQLICDAQRNRIYFVHEVVPFVRRFDLDGNELWRTEIEDYHRQQYLVKDEGKTLSIRDNEESGTSHKAVGAFLRNDTLIVSLQETSFPDRHGAHELRFIDVEAGIEKGRASVPMTIGGARGCLYVGFRNDPYPKIVGYQVDCEKGE